VGHPYYYYGGHFYRRDKGVWHRSAKPRGAWRPADRGRVPPGLRKKYAPKPRDRDRGRGPARKRRY
jgi:hypothetical protein